MHQQWGSLGLPLVDENGGHGDDHGSRNGSSGKLEEVGPLRRRRGRSLGSAHLLLSSSLILNLDDLGILVFLDLLGLLLFSVLFLIDLFNGFQIGCVLGGLEIGGLDLLLRLQIGGIDLLFRLGFGSDIESNMGDRTDAWNKGASWVK